VDSRGGSDWRTGRSILNNIIPSSTGAAKAVGRVIPSLKGKMTGMSFRVPTADVSVVDLTARLSKPTTYAEVCYAIRHASETYMKDIISYTTDQVVSTDLIGQPYPCIFDETAGIMLDHDFIKLIAWYDNEWGYSQAAVHMLSYMHAIDEAAAKTAKK
jgi:glyceraldehyde 3-phosphate dehydrogenase